jgi:hypothetical protein
MRALAGLTWLCLTLALSVTASRAVAAPVSDIFVDRLFANSLLVTTFGSATLSETGEASITFTVPGTVIDVYDAIGFSDRLTIQPYTVQLTSDGETPLPPQPAPPPLANILSEASPFVPFSISVVSDPGESLRTSDTLNAFITSGFIGNPPFLVFTGSLTELDEGLFGGTISGTIPAQDYDVLEPGPDLTKVSDYVNIGTVNFSLFSDGLLTVLTPPVPPGFRRAVIKGDPNSPDFEYETLFASDPGTAAVLVPEPSALALLGSAGLALAGVYRRRPRLQCPRGF